MSVSAVAWDLSKSANYLIGSVYVFWNCPWNILTNWGVQIAGTLGTGKA
jgi:hypothetical protein